MNQTARVINVVTQAPGSATGALIREMSFEDYRQIAALESKYGLTSKPEAKWINLWQGNPAYRQGWPIGWVMDDADGRVVGALANIPLRYEFDGRPLLVATGRGWVVDEKFRAYSLSLLARFYANKLADLHLITSANANSEPAFRLFGCKRVPAGSWDRSCFWVTSYVGFASSWMQRKGVAGRGVLRYPAAAALWAQDVLRGRANLHPDIECSRANWVDAFDERFDSFWSKLKQERKGVLLAERSRQQLEWHFCKPIEQRRIWIATITEASELRAYGIFLNADKPEYGLRRVRLIDFQSLGTSPADRESILLLVLKRCRREGVHMLEQVGSAQHGTPTSIASRTRKLDSWSHHYRTTDKELAEALSRPEAWDASLYDGDATL